MKITFRNLGPIKEGSIDLKPLTILCGPNHTGKTFAMQAIYGSLSHRHAPLFPFLEGQIQDQDVFIIHLASLLEENWEEAERTLSEAATSALPRFFQAYAGSFREAQLLMHSDKEAALQRFLQSSFHSRSMGLDDQDEEEVIVLEKGSGSGDVKITRLKGRSESLAYDLSQQVKAVVLNLRPREVFYLPAERAGINLLFRELSAARVAAFHYTDLLTGATRGENLLAPRKVMTSSYSRTVADYIDALARAPGLPATDGWMQKLGAKLASEILGIDRYDISPSGSITFVPQGGSGSALDLHLGSSTVNGLFGLWMFLARIPSQHRMLMIDEPELSLHPSNQRRIARLLARLVNAGLQVIVATHSDFFVREINSLLMAGRGRGEGKIDPAEYGLENEELLRREQVAAFEFGDGGIRPVEIDPTEGVLAKTFDDVINGLNRESQSLFLRLTDEPELAEAVREEAQG